MIPRGEACRALNCPQVDIGYAGPCVPPGLWGGWIGYATSFTQCVSQSKSKEPNERLAVAKIVLYTLTSLDGATQDP